MLLAWLNFFEWWVAGINKRRYLKEDVRYGTEMDDVVFCTSVCSFVYKKGRKHRDVFDCFVSVLEKINGNNYICSELL